MVAKPAIESLGKRTQGNFSLLLHSELRTWEVAAPTMVPLAHASWLSCSLHCHRLIEWRRRNELEASSRRLPPVIPERGSWRPRTTHSEKYFSESAMGVKPALEGDKHVHANVRNHAVNQKSPRK